ncbi:hypothetical protein AZ46_0214860 [Metabacillus indicus LMG 22858]|nr:hypothetical protein AZ46_0214860 [Metabacillus indicus LMG 22858]
MRGLPCPLHPAGVKCLPLQSTGVLSLYSGNKYERILYYEECHQISRILKGKIAVANVEEGHLHRKVFTFEKSLTKLTYIFLSEELVSFLIAQIRPSHCFPLAEEKSPTAFVPSGAHTLFIPQESSAFRFNTLSLNLSIIAEITTK